jgi:transcriptional regulator NrdR family protein
MRPHDIRMETTVMPVTLCPKCHTDDDKLIHRDMAREITDNGVVKRAIWHTCDVCAHIWVVLETIPDTKPV